MEALLGRYQPVVRLAARGHYLPDADPADVLQEGRIGLWKAVRSYRPERIDSFRSFAYLCIQRQIRMAVTRARAQKRVPPELCLSFDLVEESAARTGEDSLEQVLADESCESLMSELEVSLSPIERSVFVHQLEGRSYQETAEALSLGVKTVDNARQRIKQKASHILAAEIS
jgi:RNA polymerase sporulation-specific sigma factor